MIDFIKNYLGKSISAIILAISQAVVTVFSYLKSKNDQKQEKKKKAEIEKEKTKIDDVCNNGSLDDLFDLASK